MNKFMLVANLNVNVVNQKIAKIFITNYFVEIEQYKIFPRIKNI